MVNIYLWFCIPPNELKTKTKTWKGVSGYAGDFMDFNIILKLNNSFEYFRTKNFG